MAIDLACIRAIIRRRSQGVSCSIIAQELKLSTATVWKYGQRLLATGLTYDKLRDMSSEELEKLLRPSKRQQLDYAEPDWESIYHDEHSGQARLIDFWQAYKAEAIRRGKKFLSYSAFCRLYTQYRTHLPAELKEYSATFRHSPGVVMEIDYSGGGHGVCITDPETGEIKEAQIFVAVLAYSNLSFFCATRTQKQDDWLDAIIDALTYFGGVPEYIYVDNSTALVSRAHKHNPVVSAAFRSLCEYYGTEPFPVRPHQPRDKARVEAAVHLCQVRCLKKLAGRKFFSLEELNKELRVLTDEHNCRPFTNKFKGESRRELFETKERHFLAALPTVPYDKSMIVKVLKVRKEGCVRFNGHRYSVPYLLVGSSVRLQVLYRRNKIQIVSLQGGDITEHDLKVSDGGLSQKPEHLPPNVRFVMQTTKERLEESSKVGPASAQIAQAVVYGKTDKTAGKQLQGLQSYLRKLGSETFEKCCAIAISAKAFTYTDVTAVFACEANEKETVIRLKRGNTLTLPQKSKNIRGASNYSKQADKTHTSGD